AGKDTKKRGQMQTWFAICRAGVSEEQPKIRKILASREFMVARSAPQILPCQKSGRGTGGGCAVEKNAGTSSFA
uniref:hypothetical protein n=1 Tax=Alistipes communis TaxID=2585118 RepID=UPI003FD6C6F4